MNIGTLDFMALTAVLLVVGLKAVIDTWSGKEGRGPDFRKNIPIKHQGKATAK